MYKKLPRYTKVIPMTDDFGPMLLVTVAYGWRPRTHLSTYTFIADYPRVKAVVCHETHHGYELIEFRTPKEAHDAVVGWADDPYEFFAPFVLWEM